MNDKNKYLKNKKIIFAFALAVSALCLRLLAGDISARAAVERGQVYEGEAFIYQIQVRGTNKVEPPSLKGGGDFTAEFAGGQDSSSRMVTNINGQVTESVNEAYNLNFRITAKRTGSITIPSVTVKAGGKSLQTQPVTVQVVKPEETDDFKLRMSLSQSRVYTGEPVTLTVTLYLGSDVRNVQFSAPALALGDFRYSEISPRQEQGKRLIKLAVQGQEVVAEQGRQSLEGKEYTTVTFKRVMIPQRPGSFDLPASTVACEARTSARRQQGFFDDFFDMGFGGSYKRVVVPSNSPRIEVLDVPASGKPPNFSGNVGRFSIEADAKPTDVKVGDPITLTMKLSGPAYLEGVKPPRIDSQENIAKLFKIPAEMSPGKVEGGKMVFTQTIRAKTPDATEIPPIELSYFDTKEGAYKVARTAAIPIRVEATKELTAWDAEGAATTPEAKELLSFKGGISANYEDTDALSPQIFGAGGLLLGSWWGASTVLPPLLVLALWLAVRSVERRRSDPLSYRARGAHRAFLKRMREVKAGGKAPAQEGVLDALKEYLGGKLKMPPAALTFKDVAQPLEKCGVGAETLSALEGLFSDCEAARFAGGAGEADSGVISRAESVVASIEGSFR